MRHATWGAHDIAWRRNELLLPHPEGELATHDVPDFLLVEVDVRSWPEPRRLRGLKKRKEPSSKGASELQRRGTAFRIENMGSFTGFDERSRCVVGHSVPYTAAGKWDAFLAAVIIR